MASRCLSLFLSQMVHTQLFWLGDKLSSFSRLPGNAGGSCKERAQGITYEHKTISQPCITSCLCWLCAPHFTTAIRELEIKWWKMEIADGFFSAGVPLWIKDQGIIQSYGGLYMFHVTVFVSMHVRACGCVDSLRHFY